MHRQNMPNWLVHVFTRLSARCTNKRDRPWCSLRCDHAQLIALNFGLYRVGRSTGLVQRLGAALRSTPATQYVRPLAPLLDAPSLSFCFGFGGAYLLFLAYTRNRIFSETYGQRILNNPLCPDCTATARWVLDHSVLVHRGENRQANVRGGLLRLDLRLPMRESCSARHGFQLTCVKLTYLQAHGK